MTQLDWSHRADGSDSAEHTDREDDGSNKDDEEDYCDAADIVCPGDDAEEAVLNLEQVDVSSNN